MIKERPQLWMQSHITNIQTRFVLVQATAHWAEIYNNDNRMEKERKRERKNDPKQNMNVHETQLKRRGQQQQQFSLLLFLNREFITCLCYGCFFFVYSLFTLHRNEFTCTEMNSLGCGPTISLKMFYVLLCYSLSLRPFTKCYNALKMLFCVMWLFFFWLFGSVCVFCLLTSTVDVSFHLFFLYFFYSFIWRLYVY